MLEKTRQYQEASDVAQVAAVEKNGP